MTSAQIAALVVLGSLVPALRAGLSMMRGGDDPALVLRAAGNNAAASISMELELLAEGL